MGIMPKLENPLTGKGIELFNWKRILGMIGGVVLLAAVVITGLWLFKKGKSLIGAPETGSTLNDVLGSC